MAIGKKFQRLATSGLGHAINAMLGTTNPKRTAIGIVYGREICRS
jgi:hypothetical protein